MHILLPAATLAWLIFSLFLSHQDGEATRMTSLRLDAFFSRVSRSDEKVGGISRAGLRARSAAHFVIYFILMVLSMLSSELWGFSFLWDFLAVCSIAAADEATKAFVPGRHCSLKDIDLNLLGACAGAGFILPVIFFFG